MQLNGFNAFTDFYSHHHSLSLENLRHPKEKSHSLNKPKQPLSYFLSLWSCWLWIFHINGIISCNMWCFVPGFFHFACFQGSSLLWPPWVVLHSFLWPDNIPLCGYCTFYSFVSWWSLADTFLTLKKVMKLIHSVRTFTYVLILGLTAWV